MSEKVCIFCQKKADTREHIPAKQLFKGDLDSSLITVPSCSDCNSSFQSDEDFFRQFWASMFMEASEEAKRMFENEITRSIKRKPALAAQMFSQMQLVNAYTQAGKYSGRKTAYHISDDDRSRINRVVRKIIKGLFFYEFRAIMPSDWEIKIVWITPINEKNLGLDKLAKEPRWRVIKKETFAYWMNSVPETNQSIWLLGFFRKPLFYVLVLDELTAKGEVQV